MPIRQTAAYSRPQIALHWAIALLVAFQLIFVEKLEEMRHMQRAGETPDGLTMIIGNAHIWVGVTILILMIARIAMKVIHGAPTLLPGPRWQQILAHSIHGLLYLLLFLAPVSGGLAWFLGIREAGFIHHQLKPIFLVLIAVHVAGALWHQIVLRDGTMQRMLSSRT